MTIFLDVCVETIPENVNVYIYNNSLHNCRSATMVTNIQAKTPIVMYLPSQ